MTQSYPSQGYTSVSPEGGGVFRVRVCVGSWTTLTFFTLGALMEVDVGIRCVVKNDSFCQIIDLAHDREE